MLSDGYVKYEEAEVHRSAIMQDFRDNEKKFKNGRLAAILYFITAKFVMGYSRVRNYILFYIHGPAILHFFGLSKYHKIIRSVCLQKLIRSLADIAEHICQIKRRCDGN